VQPSWAVLDEKPTPALIVPETRRHRGVVLNYGARCCEVLGRTSGSGRGHIARMLQDSFTVRVVSYSLESVLAEIVSISTSRVSLATARYSPMTFAILCLTVHYGLVSFIWRL